MSAHADLRAANALVREGRLREAEAGYRRVLAAEPAHDEAWYNLGVVLRDLDRAGEAAAAFRQAIALKPGRAEAHNNLGLVLMAQKRFDEAVPCFEQALALKPDHVRALSNLGAARLELEDLEGAIEAFRRAIALKPDYAKAHNNLGVALQAKGRLDEAANAFGAALTADPAYAEALYNRTVLGAGTQDEAARIQGVLEAERDPAARGVLLFALGQALDRRGEHDAAFGAWREANALRRARAPFDVVLSERRMAAVAERFDAALLERARGRGASKAVGGARPIFVVGMPRSGTTLVEQIISAHPQVLGAGERPQLARIAAQASGPAPDWRALGQAYLAGLPPGPARVTDKGIVNFEHIGLIAAALPDAVIVHCRRDPRDVGVSCFSLRLTEDQAFTNDLGDFARYWRAYDRLMAHWRAFMPPGRMLEMSYEAVVEDLEGSARRMLDHCGLEWDPACLDFHRSGRPVRTVSFAQVRRPIYTSSVGRWRRYEAHLGPMLEALSAPA